MLFSENDNAWTETELCIKKRKSQNKNCPATKVSKLHLSWLTAEMDFKALLESEFSEAHH